MTNGARRWVVVTGAAGGMGQAVTRRSASDGLAVLAVDRDGDRLEQVTAELRGATGATVATLKADVTDAAIGSRVEAALPAGARLTGLVNLCGESRGDDIDGITDEDWQASFDVNVTAAMRLTRSLVGRLRAAKGASVVNVGSPVAILGARKVSYAASKAALLGLNAALARALGKDGIRVNALLPGPTVTYMTADWSEEKRQRIAAETFLGRLCNPEEVAGVVAFLLGPDSSFVTGAVLDVTGGSLLGRH